MPRANFAFTAIAAALSIAALESATAQGPQGGATAPTPPGKLPHETPYKPVAVNIAPTPADPGFTAFREQLAAVARSRVYADLTPLVVSRGFFWEGNRPGDLNPRRAPVENLAAALGLESDGGNGWKTLADFAAVNRATPLPSRPGVICAPAPPQYDFIDFDRLLAATATKASVWRYPREEGVALRAAPRPDARTMEKLGPHFVRLLSGGNANDAASAIAGWAIVAAPSGKTGYVSADMLMPLQGDRLCYHKDVTGRWYIAGYVGAGH